MSERTQLTPEPARSSDGPRGLAASEEALLEEARVARDGAYAPYSNFRVGAAVRTNAGTFRGANVENASYGLAICAERVAAATAVASGGRAIEAVAVTSSAQAATPPCGACRQFLYEFNRDMIVVSGGMGGDRKRWVLSDLLADGFGPDDLAKGGSR